MPGFARHPERRGALLVALLALAVCSACGERPADDRFSIRSAEASWSNGRLRVRLDQRIVFSEDARDALQHGVPLTVAVDVLLRDARSRSRLATFERRYQIRYLPLSERYEVSGPASEAPRSFPRLRHAVAELARLDLGFETGVLPGGDYELLVRNYLVRTNMPAPMRLPALLSRRWDHASGWTSWALSVEPGA